MGWVPFLQHVFQSPLSEHRRKLKTLTSNNENYPLAWLLFFLSLDCRCSLNSGFTVPLFCNILFFHCINTRKHAYAYTTIFWLFFGMLAKVLKTCWYSIFTRWLSLLQMILQCKSIVTICMQKMKQYTNEHIILVIIIYYYLLIVALVMLNNFYISATKLHSAYLYAISKKLQKLPLFLILFCVCICVLFTSTLCSI